MSGTALLSGREEQTLVLISRFRFLTSPQVQRFLFDGSATTDLSRAVIARRTLRSLASKQLIQRLARPIGGASGGSSPHAFCLSARGTRLLTAEGSSLPHRFVPRGTFHLRHALATADFALALQASASASHEDRLIEWSCDWETAERLGGTAIVPDGFFVYQGKTVELFAFVEIDLGTVNSKTFAAKVGRYLDLYSSANWQKSLPVWPMVLTLTPDAARARLLRRATEGVVKARGGPTSAAGTEFAFSTQSEACSDPVGPVWEIAGVTGRHALIDATSPSPGGDESG